MRGTRLSATPCDEDALLDDASALSDDDLLRLLVEGPTSGVVRGDDLIDRGRAAACPPHHAGKCGVTHPGYPDLPLDDLLSADVNLKHLDDELVRRLLLSDDVDVEPGDLAGVEDEQPLTREERVALEGALQALVDALAAIIDEMIPDYGPTGWADG